MGILQSDLAASKLQFMGLPTLINEFPVLKLPIVASDSEYPALDWMRQAAKNMSLRLVDVINNVKHRIEFSRYSYIPVGNLEDDAPLSIIDTLYARLLSYSKHVLWYSDTSKPDLGGHEDKDFRSYFQEEIENPEIRVPGFYRGYSVEIDLTYLAFNTIIMSEFFKEFEEATNVATQY